MIAAAGTEADTQEESPLRLFRSSSSGTRVATMEFRDYPGSKGRSVIPLAYSQSFVNSSRNADDANSPNSSASSSSSHAGRLYKKSCDQNAFGVKRRLYKRFSKGARHFRNDIPVAGLCPVGDECGPRVAAPVECDQRLDEMRIGESDSCYNSSDASNLDNPEIQAPKLIHKSSSESSLNTRALWQPPATDLYGVNLPDRDDPETLRSMAERNRTAAAKLFPRMQQRRHRDSGIVLHERTSSKDSGTSSPNATPCFFNSASALGSESSSIATDYSGISYPEGSLTDMSTRLDISKPEDGRSLDDEESLPFAPSYSNNDGDYGRSSESDAAANQVIEEAQSLMSSSNLVYAVPVKPIYDSLPPVRVKHTPSRNGDLRSQSKVPDGKEESSTACTNLGNGIHVNGNYEPGRFPSPQTQPKRTVVPVYPLQSYTPAVEENVKPLVRDNQDWVESLAQVKLNDQCNFSSDVCVLKIAETDVDTVAYGSNVKSDTLEDCLSKPLDTVLTNVVDKIMLEIHPNNDDSGDGDTESRSEFISSDLVQKEIGNSRSTKSRDSLQKEKTDLICRLSRKLKILKEERKEVEEEMKANDVIGYQLMSFVNNCQACPALKEKFRLYIEDVERITKLFLKLSSQFKRLTACSVREDHSDPYRIDDRKRKTLLLSQLDDAKELKNAIYRRGTQLANLLAEILSADQMVDYQYFIRMKSKLLVEAHDIDEKIQHAEMQKDILQQS